MAKQSAAVVLFETGRSLGAVTGRVGASLGQMGALIRALAFAGAPLGLLMVAAGTQTGDVGAFVLAAVMIGASPCAFWFLRELGRFGMDLHEQGVVLRTRDRVASFHDDEVATLTVRATPLRVAPGTDGAALANLADQGDRLELEFTLAPRSEGAVPAVTSFSTVTLRSSQRPPEVDALLARLQDRARLVTAP